MAMIGKDPADAPPREEVGARDRAQRRACRATRYASGCRRRWTAPPKYRRGERPSKLTPFDEALKQALKADARRRRTSGARRKRAAREIRAAGYDGGYTRLTDFIRAWRRPQGEAAVGKAFVPLAFELGEAFQFDWSEEGAGGRRHLPPAAGRRT